MAKQDVKLQADLIELSDTDLMAVVGGGIYGSIIDGFSALAKGATTDSLPVVIKKSVDGTSKTVGGASGAVF